MTDIPSLKKIAKFNFAMIVSTGMSTSDEIRETYRNIKINKKLALMNCTSEYPPVYEDINLKYIENESFSQKQLLDILITHLA